MIAIVIVVAFVGLLMACNQTPVIGSVIHDDPEVPVQPVGDANITPQVSPAVMIPIVAPLPPVIAFVDPSNPIEPPDQGDVAPPVDDPMWVSDPVVLSAAPDLPVKSDPVAYVPPVYFDPENPVPTTAEKQANDTAIVVAPNYGTIQAPIAALDQPTDYALPLPTPQSDPDQFSQPPDAQLAPDENPIDNWTAESTPDTECPPTVEIEYGGGVMS